MALRLFTGRTAVAASAAAGIAAVTVSPSPARARAAEPLQVDHACSAGSAQSKPLDDEWVLAERSGEVLIFNPFSAAAIDEAISEVGLYFSPARHTPSVSVTEEGTINTPASGVTSEGEDADFVLSSQLPTSAGPAVPSVVNSQLTDLLRVTGSLMRRPGFQKEVVLAMMEDNEVRSLLLHQAQTKDLEAYLLAVGIHSSGLLPAPEAPSSGTDAAESHPSPFEVLLETVLSAAAAAAGAASTAGHLLAEAGGWVKDRLGALANRLTSTMFGPEEEQKQEELEGAEARGSREGPAPRTPRTRGDVLLGGVMMLAVAVMFSLILRRPLILRRV